MVVAYNTAEGPVSDTIEKANSVTSGWFELKTTLKRRFGGVIDHHYGISLFTLCKQGRYETVATYGERYTEVTVVSQISD